MNSPKEVNLFSMIGLTLVLLVLPRPTLGQPVGSVDLLLSVDDGVGFQDSAIVDDMNSFLLRLYFDNTGDEPGTDASVTVNLPAGFSHVGGTTRLSLGVSWNIKSPPTR